jgi:16S rRNA (uracil1498-N3)-methyltransferase
MEATFYMARRRFFVDEIRNEHAEILGDEARHLTQVLRVEAGQRFEISDDRSVWLAEIEQARKEHVRFRVLERIEVPEPCVRVELFAALIKFDHFELLIEKATELGVDRITPVVTVRSEHGLEQGAAKRIARWRRIAVEASQQSRRAHLPEIVEPVRFAAAVSTPVERRFLLDEDGAGRNPLLEELRLRALGDRVALLVGPEGGWVDSEREFAAAAGWRPVTLGPLILRAETAAISALAVIYAAYQVG